MSSAELADIIVDCRDPESLANFWSRLLKREIVGKVGPYVILKKDPGEVGLAFQRVEEPKGNKNRVHVDLNCEDVHATAAWVEAHGGRREPGYESGGFLVMSDPEGNEFCLLPRNSPLGLDAYGKAHYLDEGNQ